MARVETRFGVAPALGTTYTQLGSAVTTDKRWNVLFSVTNLTGDSTVFDAYIADNSWTTGEPTGGTLIAQIIDGMVFGPHDYLQVGGIIYHEGDKIVVRASVASSLSVIAQGTEAPDS